MLIFLTKDEDPFSARSRSYWIFRSVYMREKLGFTKASENVL